MIRAEYNGISKNVGKLYAEHGGVSANVVKVYAENGGVSKLIYTLGRIVSKLVRNSTVADDLSIERAYIGGGSTKNHAFFVGGDNDSGEGTKNVDAYDINGVMTAATDYAYSQARAVCVQNGDESNPVLLVCRGTTNSSSTSGNSSVYYYKDDLTRSSATSLNTFVCNQMVFTLGGKSYVAGGRSSSYYYSVCNCYTAATTRTTITSLNKNRAYGGGAATDEFGAIVGGRQSTSNIFGNIDIYNKSNVRSESTLSIARYIPYVARLGDGILVANGAIATSTYTDSIEYINKDKLISTIGTLHSNNSYGSCIGGKDLVSLFTDVGRTDSNNVLTFEAEYINDDMVATLSDPMKNYHSYGAAARLGNRIFVGGGTRSGVKNASVEIYDIKREVIT